jgi:hypothetical protein
MAVGGGLRGVASADRRIELQQAQAKLQKDARANLPGTDRADAGRPW